MKDIRKILNLARPYWGRIALAGMGSIVVSGMNGFLAWLAKPAVDKLFVEKKAEYLPFIALGCRCVFNQRNLFFLPVLSHAVCRLKDC